MKRYQARRKEKVRHNIKLIGLTLILIGVMILLPILGEAEYGGITDVKIKITLAIIGTPIVVIGFFILKAVESVEKHYPLDKWLNQ